MPIEDPDAIKRIVRSNFEKSAKRYETFEQQYGVFNKLTLDLAAKCHIKPGMTVADIGCGTGASTFTLADLVGPKGSVIGIDFSANMLEIAREKNALSNVEFRLGDADNVNKFIGNKIDAILFNACIFLIPTFEETLASSYTLLKEDSYVGMNYLLGLFDQDNVDLLQLVKEKDLDFAPYGRSIVDTSTLPKILTQIGYTNISSDTIAIEMERSQIMDFYSIPAHSAGLYPKTPYSDRLHLLDVLLTHLETFTNTIYQRWGWVIGKN